MVHVNLPGGILEVHPLVEVKLALFIWNGAPWPWPGLWLVLRRPRWEELMEQHVKQHLVMLKFQQMSVFHEHWWHFSRNKKSNTRHWNENISTKAPSAPCLLACWPVPFFLPRLPGMGHAIRSGASTEFMCPRNPMTCVCFIVSCFFWGNPRIWCPCFCCGVCHHESLHLLVWLKTQHGFTCEKQYFDLYTSRIFPDGSTSSVMGVIRSTKSHPHNP